MIICVIAIVILIFLEYMLAYFAFLSKVKRFNTYAFSFNVPVIDIPDKLLGRIRLWRRYNEFLRFVHIQEFSLHINGGIDFD